MLIREANSQDTDGIAIVHVDCWKTTYKGIVLEEYLDKMSYKNSNKIYKNILNNKTENELLYVAELDCKVIGFAYVGPGRNVGTVYESELYSIYILKEYQNMRLGKKFLSEIAQFFLKKDINTMYVEVLADNVSRRFYEHMGAKK